MADDTHPGYDRTRASRGSPDRSGERVGGDATLMHGQYPPNPGNDIFGGTLPSGTGAPGSAGAGGPVDETTESGQLTDDFTGVSGRDITSTGAPGSTGGSPSTGGSGGTVGFTRPGSYLSGTYTSEDVRDNVDGPGNWTEANDSGYATGGPKLPGMHEPTSTGAGQGRVLRGGRNVR